MKYLNEQHLADFHRDGYVIVRGLLEKEEVTDLLNRADAMVAGTCPSDGFACGSASQVSEDDPGRLIIQIKPTEVPLRDLIFAAWYDHPTLKAVGAQVLDSGSVEPFQQQVLIKEPGEANGTPWHQDDFYWHKRDERRKITAWVPLLPTSEANGTMWMIPGSHKGGILNHVAAGGISRFHEIEQAVDESGAVPLELEVGDVSFHHQCLIHGAKANSGNHRRVALAMHFRAASGLQEDTGLTEKR